MPFILPGLLIISGTLAVHAARRGNTALVVAVVTTGWLVTSTLLTVLAREGRPWPLVAYFQNLSGLLVVCGIPFLVTYGACVWLRAHGATPFWHFSLTLVAALLAVPLAGIVGLFLAAWVHAHLGWKFVDTV